MTNLNSVLKSRDITLLTNICIVEAMVFPGVMYGCEKVKVKSLSCVRLLATPWTAAYQAPPPMGFSRQEYWCGLPLPCERWTIKKTECQRIDAFELWCWRRLLKISWTPKRSNQSIIKEINPKERREKERRGGRTGFAPLGSWGVERFLHPGKSTH